MPQVLLTVAQVWCSSMATIARIAHLGIRPWMNSLSPNSKSPWKSLGDCCIAFIPERPCCLRATSAFAKGVEATAGSLIKTWGGSRDSKTWQLCALSCFFCWTLEEKPEILRYSSISTQQKGILPHMGNHTALNSPGWFGKDSGLLSYANHVASVSLSTEWGCDNDNLPLGSTLNSN